MNKLEEDIQFIVNNAKKLGFANKSFLITGATGMIGRIFVNAISKITNNKNIYVLGFDLQEAKIVFGKSNFNIASFETLDEIDNDIDFVVHLASPTNPRILKEKPVETISFIYESTKQILNFSLKHNSKILYISSMEVYGEIFDDNVRYESDLGYVDLNNTRSSYPEAKRICELLCYSFYKELNLDVCVARLAQTFGAGTPSSDPRIFGYLGRCVVNKENIILKTKGDSFGNYCYLSDTLCAFLYILANGKSGETYNIVGDNCRSTIFELASMVSQDVASDSIDIKFDLSNTGQYPNPTKLNMSNEKLKQIGWEPNYSLKDMFIRMIESWRE